jgi:hypothetical protein
MFRLALAGSYGVCSGGYSEQCRLTDCLTTSLRSHPVMLRASEIARRRTEEERGEAFLPLRVTTTAADPRARCASSSQKVRNQLCCAARFRRLALMVSCSTSSAA